MDQHPVGIKADNLSCHARSLVKILHNAAWLPRGETAACAPTAGDRLGLVLAKPSRYGETTSVAAGVDDPSERRSRTRQGQHRQTWVNGSFQRHQPGVSRSRKLLRGKSGIRAFWSQNAGHLRRVRTVARPCQNSGSQIAAGLSPFTSRMRDLPSRERGGLRRYPVLLSEVYLSAASASKLAA